jgi:glycosyltransferase involved in cell wall biosynthesis
MKEHLLSLSAGLSARGHEVVIAAPGGSDVAQASVEAGFEVRDIPLVGPLHPLKDPAAIAAIRAIVRGRGFDLVHAHGFKAGFVGRLGARLGGNVPFVLTAHNHVLFRDDTPRAAKARYRFVERALARYVTRYIAVSDSIRAELIDGYGLPAEQIMTVHNGVEAAPFLAPQDCASERVELGIPASATVVGLAARFSTQKGLRHLIDAVPELRANHPEVVVAIGGSGPLESELREHAAAIGAGPHICWPGHVADMPRFLAALDIYVSPAETEALGIGLIEAAIAQIPTVATDVGGVSEVVVDDETGLLVPPADPHALAAAVLALLGDPERAQAMAGAARERAVREFDPARMVDRTLAVYEAALTAKDGAS